MVIQELQLEYLDDFYLLFEDLMHEGYANFPVELREYFLARDYSKKNIMLWLERNFRKIFLAMVDGEIVGFIVGDNTYGGVGFVSWLGIKPNMRKRGIGTQLLKAYEDYIITLGAHLLELYASDDVKPFYEKYGMHEIGRRNNGYNKKKNVIMDKPLGQWNSDNIRIVEHNS